MVKVYGASDDLVEIEGSKYKETEIGCFNKKVRIWFEDGTIIVVGYPKEDMGVWFIIVENKGTALQDLEPCFDEDSDMYSDVFRISSEIVKHKVF